MFCARLRASCEILGSGTSEVKGEVTQEVYVCQLNLKIR